MDPKTVFKICQFILTFAGSPLVVKLIDNMIAGTTTKIDDAVWKVVRMFLAGGSINEVEPALAEVQREYEADKEEAKKPAEVYVDFQVG